MADDPVSLKITPQLDFSGLRSELERAGKEVKRWETTVADLDKQLIRTASSAAKGVAGTGGGIGNIRQATRFVEQQARQVLPKGLPFSPEALAGVLAASPGHPMSQAFDAFNQRRAAEDAKRAAITAEREARYKFNEAKGSSEGVMARRKEEGYRRIHIGTLQRHEDDALLDSPEGRVDELARVDSRGIRRQRMNLLSQSRRPEHRRLAAQQLGIDLPEDIHPFAKLLQATFKTATSMGMLEALSGGSAAPLARAFASQIIGGALLPAAMTGFATIGKSVGGLFTAGAAGAAASGEGAVAGGIGGALTALGPVGAAVAAVGLAVGGAALYGSSNVADKNKMEEQLWAAVGGQASSQPNNLIESVLSAAAPYGARPDAAVSAMAVLGNMGVQTSGKLGGPGTSNIQGNTENSLILSGLMANGSTPAQAAQSVGSWATLGGANADQITQMIGLMAVQNQLTKDQAVPLDAMATNMDALVNASGGGPFPVGAGTVAGLSTIAHALAQQGPAGRTPGLAGQLMGPLQGAVGLQAVAAESILGLSATQLQALQNDKSGHGMVTLFNKLSGFVRGVAGNGKTPADQLQMATVALQVLSSVGLVKLSGGAAGVTAEAQAMLKDNPQALGKQLSTFLGNIPSPGAVKAEASAAILQGISVQEQGIANTLREALGFFLHTSDQLDTVAHLLLELAHPHGTPGAAGVPTPTSLIPLDLNNDFRLQVAMHGGMPKRWGRYGAAWRFPDGTSYNPAANPMFDTTSGKSAYGTTEPPNLLVPKINLNGTMERIGVNPRVYAAMANAANATGIPLEILLAQGARESSLNPYAAGGGLGQFGASTVDTIRQHALAGKKPGASSLDKLAASLGLANFNSNNMGQSAMAMGWYDQYLTQTVGHGNLKQGLEYYNAGPNADLTHNRAAQNYGDSVMTAAGDITVTVVIEDKTHGGVHATPKPPKKKALGAHSGDHGHRAG